MNSSPVPLFYDSLKKQADKDALDFDLYGFIQNNTSVMFKKTDRDISSNQDKHINLRVLKKGKVGTSWTKDFSQKGLDECYQKAKEALNWSDVETAGELSLNQNYHSVKNFYHTDFDKISGDEKLKKAWQIHQSCSQADPSVEPVYCYVMDHDKLSFFANSQQSCGDFKSSYVFAVSYCLAYGDKQRDKQNSNGMAWAQSREYSNIDALKIGQQSAQRALKKRAYQIPKTKKYPVIFKAGPASGSLLKFLVDLMSAKKVFEGLSLLKDSLNKPLFSKNLFVYDDPLALWGSNAEIFDAEGFLSEKTSLVEKGVFSNYLSSSFYAKKMGIPHTKKAVWENNELVNSPSNLIMQEGESSFEELVSEAPEMIVIDTLRGLHSGYNPISGDFSFQSEGFLYRSGEAIPLCEFTVSGQILKVFADIVKIAKDSQIQGSIQSPSFLVPELMIAGT